MRGSGNLNFKDMDGSKDLCNRNTEIYKSLDGSLLTNKIYAGTMGYHGSTRSPILHIAQSYPVFAAKIVILHWQIFPVHPHDYENFWPSCRFFLTSPENKIRN